MLKTASALNWTASTAAEGRIHLVSPGPGSTTLDAVPAASELRLIGSPQAGPFLPSAIFFAATTRGVLSTPADGVTLSARSAVLSVFLNVLLPAAGTLYADDFRTQLTPGVSAGMMLLSRLAFDALGVEMVLLSFTNPAFLAGAIGCFVVNRILAVIGDLRVVGVRNSLARSGVSAPPTERLISEAQGAKLELALP